jgi:hypothetical protein
MEQHDGITILKEYALARKKRIQPCQIYDANVSTSIMDESTGWHLQLVSGHVLSHQIHMTYRRRRAHIAASEEYISLQIEGRLDVGVCSINCVNRVLFVNVPTTLRVSGDPRWPIFVPRAGQQGEALSDFLDLPSVHSTVAAVINSQKDSLHILNGAICLYFQPDSAEALQLAIESVSELVGVRARMTRTSLRSLPKCFKPLITLIQEWPREMTPGEKKCSDAPPNPGSPD